MILSDSELVEMLREPRTRREGFAVLVKQYSEKLYWKVRRIVLSHEDANDVLQNVFIKVWSNLQNFQGKSSLSTWLYRIAINESLDFLRKQKLADKVSADEDVSVTNILMVIKCRPGYRKRWQDCLKCRERFLILNILRK